MKKKLFPRSRSLMIIAISIVSCLAFVAGGTNGAAPVPLITSMQVEGDFAYVSNSGSQDVTMYQVNQQNGTLQPIGTVPAGGGPQAIAVAPAMDQSPFAVSGRPVFVVNENTNNVSMYSVNPSTGQLTPIGTVPAGTSPQAVAVDPQGHMAIVANGDSNDVSVYSISPTGGLNPVGTVPAGQDPVAVTVHPNGQFAYVANEGSSNISVYSVNPSTGGLTPMGQPVAMPQGSGAPSSIDVLPTGNVAVATSPSTNTMGVFLVNTTPSPFLPGLVPVGSFPVGGSGPTSIDIGPNGIAAVTLMSQSTGKSAAQNVGAIAIFQISSTGTVTLRGIAPTINGSGPTDVAVDPGGVAYVTNRNTNNVSVFAIMPSGLPMSLGTVPAGTSPQSVAVAF